jgi:DNA-binding NtrC family response regulator
MAYTPSLAGQILVVDDEEDFRAVVAEHLEDLGYRAITASDGMEALALVRRRSFDVALVDLKMPGMSGVEVLQALHRLDLGIEVIIVTGHVTSESAADVMTHGAYACLRKPCRLNELENVVAAAMGRRRPQLESDPRVDQLG